MSLDRRIESVVSTTKNRGKSRGRILLSFLLEAEITISRDRKDRKTCKVELLWQRSPKREKSIYSVIFVFDQKREMSRLAAHLIKNALAYPKRSV